MTQLNMHTSQPSTMVVKCALLAGHGLVAVYISPCSEGGVVDGCGPATYVGQTGRLIQHKRALTTANPMNSALAEHAINTGHEIDWSDARVNDANPLLHQRCNLESWLAHPSPPVYNQLNRHTSQPSTAESPPIPFILFLYIHRSLVCVLCFLHFYWGFSVPPVKKKKSCPFPTPFFPFYSTHFTAVLTI